MENSVKERKAKADKNFAKGKQTTVQNKPDTKRLKTIVPDNDNGEPGAASESSSNVGQGPAIENL
jgi:hypothetical protein